MKYARGLAWVALLASAGPVLTGTEGYGRYVAPFVIADVDPHGDTNGLACHDRVSFGSVPDLVKVPVAEGP